MLPLGGNKCETFWITGKELVCWVASSTCVDLAGCCTPGCFIVDIDHRTKAALFNIVCFGPQGEREVTLTVINIGKKKIVLTIKEVGRFIHSKTICT